jgi:DNA polymerase-3 subunit epsilon
VLFSNPPWDEVDYWALDLETGGLDPRSDAILAVGMVPVRRAAILLREAYRTLVRPHDGTRIDPRSVEIHQLVWGEVTEAPPLEEVLPEIERRLREGVLLVHHRTLDVRFLRRAYRRTGMRWKKPRVVDTVDLLMKIAKRARQRTPHLPDDTPVLNLARARKIFGLPDYQAHDALTDAVATAELFLVLRKVLGAQTLGDLR